LLLLATIARASTVDFNNFSPIDSGLTVASYQGLTFTPNAGFMGVWIDNPNGNGTPSLVYDGFGSGGAGVTMTKTGGGAFDLGSLDMTISWYDNLSSDTVNLVANLLGGGQTTETLSLIQGLQTYNLNLQNVTSVAISEVASNSGYWLMDNVNYNSSVTPEPGSLLLLGTGLAGIAVAIRRKVTA